MFKFYKSANKSAYDANNFFEGIYQCAANCKQVRKRRYLSNYFCQKIENNWQKNVSQLSNDELIF